MDLLVTAGRMRARLGGILGWEQELGGSLDWEQGLGGERTSRVKPVSDCFYYLRAWIVRLWWRVMKQRGSSSRLCGRATEEHAGALNFAPGIFPKRWQLFLIFL
jgi:hypothetical protein